MALTDAEIIALQPKSRPYKLSIGEGAYLLVTPNGRKYWRLKYFLDGKENIYSIGVCPKVSVEAAKAARDSARALIRKGINPTVARREARVRPLLPAQPVFTVRLSGNGALSIETDAIALTLSPLHTQALLRFLTGKPELGKESDE